MSVSLVLVFNGMKRTMDFCQATRVVPCHIISLQSRNGTTQTSQPRATVANNAESDPAFSWAPRVW